ncbi:hypothetical protein ACOME3_007684 [Neoechinorhynchus agilis]
MIHRTLIAITHRSASTAIRSGISPLIDRPTRSKLLEELTIELKADPIVTSSLALVAANGRERLIPKLLSQMAEIGKGLRKELQCTIWLCEPLSSQKKSKLEDALSAIAKGSTLRIDYQIDPSILGGLKVQIGNGFIDLSIQNTLNRCKEAL